MVVLAAFGFYMLCVFCCVLFNCADVDVDVDCLEDEAAGVAAYDLVAMYLAE